MIRYFNVLIFALAAIINVNLTGQNFDYRYYESPAVSWSGITMYDSRQLAMGGISLAASGNSMQIGNPALFTTDKKVELGFSYNYIYYQSFQYWGINEGVKNNQEPFSEKYFFPASLAVSFGFGNWNLTAGWYRSALNDFPDFLFLNEYDHDQYDHFKGSFRGFDETYFVSFGLVISPKISAGLKIEYKRGTRDTDIENFSSYYYFLDGYWQLKETMSVYSEYNISEIFIPELGFVINIDPKLKAGLTIKYPLKGKVDRKIVRSLSNNDGLSINDNYIFNDDYYDVPGFSIGMLYDSSGTKAYNSGGKFIVGAELEYRNWSDYKYIFFGEEQQRETVDTLKFSAGAEYGKKLRKMEIFIRVGLGLDKQPVSDPETVLKIISSGIGVRFHAVNVGIGMSYIHGSSGGISQDHMIVCTSVSKVL